MSHDVETEFADLAQALREVRPTPEAGFTRSLDQAVADHFPPEWAYETAVGQKGRGGVGSLTERLRRRLGGRRVSLPAMAGFAGLLVVATVVVGAVESGRFGSDGNGSEGDTATVTSQNSPRFMNLDKPSNVDAGAAQAIEDALGGDGAEIESFRPNSAGSTALDMAGRTSGYARSGVKLYPESRGFAYSDKGNRDVAREAEITLGTDPGGVQDVANEVVSVTDEHNGIVMDSTVTDGQAGKAGARFSLLIPTGQIESAVADLSGIADLRSRSQELTDITAPVNKAEDAIADSKAKIKSLLGELEETYDEGERANLERRIRWERNDLRWHETRLKRLERRADYTPVSLRVETGGESGSDDESTWGLSEAVDDAGKLLGVAAGVTLLALAVAIPIGIVLLIALALNRAWVRRSRRRALADDE